MVDEPKNEKTKGKDPEIVLESEKPIFSWKAPEFAHYQKNQSWFLLVTIIGIAVAAFFFWQKNWTATAVVVAALIALISQSRVKPKNVSCVVYRQGIVVNDKAYPFSAFKSFWIIYGEHPTIRFEQTRRFSAHINVPIADEEPDQIKLFLSKFLPMDENRGEDFSDTVQRWIKF